jgi:hypothetical protein
MSKYCKGQGKKRNIMEDRVERMKRDGEKTAQKLKKLEPAIMREFGFGERLLPTQVVDRLVANEPVRRRRR